MKIGFLIQAFLANVETKGVSGVCFVSTESKWLASVVPGGAMVGENGNEDKLIGTVCRIWGKLSASEVQIWAGGLNLTRNSSGKVSPVSKYEGPGALFLLVD
jgi:hypothetical protein